MDYHTRTAALTIVLLAATSCGAAAQTNEPIKIAVGVDSAYVSLYLSKQHKLFRRNSRRSVLCRDRSANSQPT
jgi:hypothetical protein